MDSCSAVVLIILHLCGYYIIHINVLNTILSNILCIYIYICSIKKKRGVYALLRCEVLVWVAFLAVARGSTMSQADRLTCPTRYVQCIDERIVVDKQQLPETLISVCCFISKEGGIRAVAWSERSRGRLLEKTKKWSRIKLVLFEDFKSTRREVGCIKPLSRTNTLTLFITE